MLGEEGRRGAMLGQLPRRRLRAIFAELEDVWRGRLRPGAAWAGVTARLVLAHQREASTHGIAIAREVLGQAPDRAPTARRSAVGMKLHLHAMGARSNSRASNAGAVVKFALGSITRAFAPRHRNDIGR